MPMPRTRLTNTHGLEADESAKPTVHAEKPHTRQALTAVVMTLQGIPAETIAQTLGYFRVSIWRYVNWRNSQGMRDATDVLKSYRLCYSVHPSGERMESQHVGKVADMLMRANRGKQLWVILDNYRP